MLHAFDTQGRQRRKKPRDAAARGDRANARAFHCAACMTRVCDESDLVSSGGATRHQFRNRAGLAFEIACFARAACRAEGEPTLEDTWFPGHAWSFASCRNCGTQLGWFFSGASCFYGLILARLIAGA